MRAAGVSLVDRRRDRLRLVAEDVQCGPPRRLSSAIPTSATRRRAGRVRVDCDSHTMWSRRLDHDPGRTRRRGDREWARRVVHHRPPRHRRAAVTDALPCRVVVGEEFRSTQGEIIGLFLTERIPFGLTPHEAARVSGNRAGSCTSLTRSTRCAAIWSSPHSKRWSTKDSSTSIEVHDAKTSMESSTGAAARSPKSDLAAGAGSDAHVPDALGRPTSRSTTSTAPSRSSRRSDRHGRRPSSPTRPARGARASFPRSRRTAADPRTDPPATRRSRGQLERSAGTTELVTMPDATRGASSAGTAP